MLPYLIFLFWVNEFHHEIKVERIAFKNTVLFPAGFLATFFSQLSKIKPTISGGGNYFGALFFSWWVEGVPRAERNSNEGLFYWSVGPGPAQTNAGREINQYSCSTIKANKAFTTLLTRETGLTLKDPNFKLNDYNIYYF